MFTFVKKAGFTMIELLVVIAVIGILAVALLATLNPLEQIRKGRDTRTRADASQLASALERYNASLGKFPWQASEGQAVTVDFKDIKNSDATGTIDPPCSVTSCVMKDVLTTLTDTSEVKSSFIDRITATGARDLYVYYNAANTGSSVTVCFMPESNTFAREAYDRCATGTFGSDFLKAKTPSVGNQTFSTATTACPDADYTSGFSASDADELICLP
jgi:prepilin-type N-terminal cleavage/methylation domain-containing protein